MVQTIIRMGTFIIKKSERIGSNISVVDEDIPESTFMRIKAVWLFNRNKMRKIPYIKNLLGESIILYLIPIIFFGVGYFFYLILTGGINLFDTVLFFVNNNVL